MVTGLFSFPSSSLYPHASYKKTGALIFFASCVHTVRGTAHISAKCFVGSSIITAFTPPPPSRADQKVGTLSRMFPEFPDDSVCVGVGPPSHFVAMANPAH